MRMTNAFFLLLLFLFFTGLALFVSGIQISPESNRVRTISLIFGIILILATIFIGILATIHAIYYY